MKFTIVEAKLPKTFYKDIDGKKVYIVDGNYIRTHLEKEFTNFSQHYEFPNLIPEGEIWLDKEAAPGEMEEYISHAVTEYDKMAAGASYETAHEKGKKIEKSRRNKTMLKKDDARIKLWKKLTTSKIKVFIVDGETVRNQFNIDFTEGGHGYVYNFIPKDEIWIDNDIEPKERRYILAHEFYEMGLMKNKNIPYDQAHKLASRFEKDLRKKS
jgi:hypothetical protein